MSIKLDGDESTWTAALLAELDLVRHDLSAGDIVVGAEYGISGYQALRRAAQIAQARRRRLRIVRVVREVDWLLDPRPLEELVAAGEHLGRSVLDDYTSIARSIAPEIDIDTRLARGSLYTHLTRETGTAGLLVLGAGDDHQPAASGERASRPAASWFTQHAWCPVLVVDRDGHEVRDGNPARNRDYVARYGDG